MEKFMATIISINNSTLFGLPSHRSLHGVAAERSKCRKEI